MAQWPRLHLPHATSLEAPAATRAARPKLRGALPLARLTPVPALLWDSGFSGSQALFCLEPISQPSRDLSKVSGPGEAWVLQGFEPSTLCHQDLSQWPPALGPRPVSLAYHSLAIMLLKFQATQGWRESAVGSEDLSPGEQEPSGSLAHSTCPPRTSQGGLRQPV